MSVSTRLAGLEALVSAEVFAVHRSVAVGASTSYLCSPVPCFWIHIFFSDIFKDSFKVLSQCYRRKPTKMARHVNAVNCIRVQDSQATFFLQGLSCFHFNCLSD